MAYQKTVPTPTDASIILTYRCPITTNIIQMAFAMSSAIILFMISEFLS